MEWSKNWPIWLPDDAVLLDRAKSVATCDTFKGFGPLGVGVGKTIRQDAR